MQRRVTPEDQAKLERIQGSNAFAARDPKAFFAVVGGFLTEEAR